MEPFLEDVSGSLTRRRLQLFASSMGLENIPVGTMRGRAASAGRE